MSDEGKLSDKEPEHPKQAYSSEQLIQGGEYDRRVVDS